MISALRHLFCVVILLLGSSLFACQFDGGGPGRLGGDAAPPLADQASLELHVDLSSDGPSDGPRDLLGAEEIGADHSGADLRLDQPDITDLGPDLGHDLPPVIPSITTSALSEALVASRVPCVYPDGSAGGNEIPIVDRATLAFFDGSVSLAGADPATITWAGPSPWVTIFYDPNTCGEERPGDNDWSAAGFLIRGAWIDKGELHLAPGTTAADINLFDTNSSGVWQEEFAAPDDSLLANYPQLVAPVTKAKQEILRLGLP
ncbi:MAG: hypothetical protein JRH20_21295 [Deltaproteobacteria bacterium]|nr:hypothetical protein [Deltaproteobacteria bacterium]